MRVMSLSSLNINVFWSVYKKICLKGSEVWRKVISNKIIVALVTELCRFFSLSRPVCVGSLLIPLDSFFLEPGPAATMVGNIVMGTRIGGASGREIADIEEDSDMAKKVNHL